MVTKQQALKTSLAGAAVAWGTQYASHQIFGYSEQATLQVGFVIALVMFVFAYQGMIRS